jgi:hypothetical protein
LTAREAGNGSLHQSFPPLCPASMPLERMTNAAVAATGVETPVTG